LPSIAALTLVPLIALGQTRAPQAGDTKPAAPAAATPAAATPAAATPAAATEAPATAAPAPAAPPAAMTPAANAIPEEFGIPPGFTFSIGKFKSTLYGFVEADNIYDSTRSFVDLPGMNAISAPNTASGDDGRYQMSIRNSRLGYKIESPEWHGLRASGQLEMDFFGNQPGTPPDTSTGYAESAFFNNPTFRVRHAVLKLDNDYVTLWFGQTWELVGWQSDFQPNTVEIQGVPGELYSRTMQVRALHDFHFGNVGTLSIAVAALRPPQMDAAIPDFQAGIKFTLDQYTGMQTVGSTGSGIRPAGVGFSGALRTYKLLNGETVDSTSTNTGWAGAADIMIPIIPAKKQKAWALTFLGEYVDGSGDADLYTSLKGGASAGAPAGAPASYSADIDPGLAGWSTTTNTVQTIDWQTFILSAQFYLPPDGRLWLAGSYSNSLSDNIGNFGKPTGVFFHEIWWDVDFFADVIPNAVRLGVEFQNYQQTYGGGVQAQDLRGQLSAWYIF
jgi:hypothetical protein